MPSHDADLLAADKVVDRINDLIRERVIYLDTVRVFLPHYLPDGQRYELIKLNRGRKIRKPHKLDEWHVAYQHGWRYVQQLDQPTWAVLGALADMVPTHKTSRLHIAADLMTESERHARRLRYRLRRYVVIRRGREQMLWDRGGMTYFARQGASRNIALYDDERSKVAPGPCAHLELRLQRTDTFKRLGLGDLTAITSEAIRAVYQDQVGLFTFREKWRFNDSVGREIEVFVADRIRARRKEQGVLFTNADMHAERRAAQSEVVGHFANKLFGWNAADSLGFSALHYQCSIDDPPELRWADCPIQNALSRCKTLVGANVMELDNAVLLRGARIWDSMITDNAPPRIPQHSASFHHQIAPPASTPNPCPKPTRTDALSRWE